MLAERMPMWEEGWEVETATRREKNEERGRMEGRGEKREWKDDVGRAKRREGREK